MNASADVLGICLTWCLSHPVPVSPGDVCLTQCLSHPVMSVSPGGVYLTQCLSHPVMSISPGARVVAEAVAVGSLLAVHLELEALLLLLLRDVERVLVLTPRSRRLPNDRK